MAELDFDLKNMWIRQNDAVVDWNKSLETVWTKKVFVYFDKAQKQ